MSRLTSHLLQRLKERDDAIVYMQHHHNNWIPRYAHQILSDTSNLAASLKNMGLKKNSRICSLIDSSYEMFILDIAAYCLGIIIIPLLAFQSKADIQYILSETTPDLILLKDENQLFLLPELTHSFPYIFIDTLLKENVQIDLHEAAKIISDQQEALITFTSGTTGAIKGCVFTQHALYEQNVNFLDTIPSIYTPDKKILIMTLSGGIWFHLLIIQCITAECIFYIGNLPDYKELLLSAKPEVLPIYADVLKVIHEDIINQSNDPEKQINLLTDTLGGSCKTVIAAATQSTPATIQFFQSAGIQYLNVYASTETLRITVTPFGNKKLTCVGRPINGTEVKLANDGEILVKTPSMFSHYLNDDLRTQNAFIEGWFATGDIGSIDAEGDITLICRKSDVYKSLLGFKIYPLFIENKLTACPYIYQACVFGDGKPYLVALITVAPNLAPFDIQKIIPLVDVHIKNVNAELGELSKIKKYKILDTQFSEKLGEITPYRKVIRRVIFNNYQSIIKSLYDAPF